MHECLHWTLALLIAIKVGVVYYHIVATFCVGLIVVTSVPVSWLYPDLFGASECGACAHSSTARHAVFSILATSAATKAVLCCVLHAAAGWVVLHCCVLHAAAGMSPSEFG